MIYNTKDNVVIKLYYKFNLIASKIIVLSIKKDKRTFDDFIDADLPQPTFIIEHYEGYFIGYAIKSTIKTKKQKEFYKDLSLRLKKTFLKRTSLKRVENSSVWALQYALDNGYVEVHRNNIYEMKYLASACESLTSKEEKEKRLDNSTTKEELAIYASTYEKSEDALFDFIRHKVYDYKKIALIEKREVTLKDLENYALAIAKIGYEVVGGKGISTAHAKAKNIAKWTFYNYGKRKRKTKTEEELQMTRRERALTNAREKYEKAHKKIINLITGLYAEEYKKRGRKYNITKIAKELKMSRDTIRKHLRDENLI